MNTPKELYRQFVNKYTIDDMRSNKKLCTLYEYLNNYRDQIVIYSHSARLGNLINKYLTHK